NVSYPRIQGRRSPMLSPGCFGKTQLPECIRRYYSTWWPGYLEPELLQYDRRCASLFENPARDTLTPFYDPQGADSFSQGCRMPGLGCVDRQVLKQELIVACEEGQPVRIRRAPNGQDPCFPVQPLHSSDHGSLSPVQGFAGKAQARV